MASKQNLFACLTCGEHGKGKFLDIFELSESHMCPITNDEQKKDSLLKFRAIVNEEITKLSGKIYLYLINKF